MILGYYLDRLNFLIVKINSALVIGFLLSFSIGFAQNGADSFDCSQITSKPDRYTDEITFKTKADEPISFVKIKSKDSSFYYLRIAVKGAGAALGDGFTLLLDNGEKVIKEDEEISIRVLPGAAGKVKPYEYSAFVELTDADVALLSQHSIVSAKLYIYESDFKNTQPYMQSLKCLTQK